MKVPKEILKYLEYALGFCEERGLKDYERIAEIIVENDEDKDPEFKWVHRELEEIRKDKR